MSILTSHEIAPEDLDGYSVDYTPDDLRREIFDAYVYFRRLAAEYEQRVGPISDLYR